MYGVKTLLKAATATGAGASINLCGLDQDAASTFQAIGMVSASTGSAVVAIEVSNDNVNWITMGTITLTLGTAATSDGFYSQAAWNYVRANVTTLTGADASVTVLMGA